jgi:hypothetical protein
MTPNEIYPERLNERPALESGTLFSRRDNKLFRMDARGGVCSFDGAYLMPDGSVIEAYAGVYREWFRFADRAHYDGYMQPMPRNIAREVGLGGR